MKNKNEETKSFEAKIGKRLGLSTEKLRCGNERRYNEVVIVRNVHNYIVASALASDD